MGVLNGHFGSLQNMYQFKNTLNRLFHILNELEDFIKLICTKISFLFYTITPPIHHGVESIVDRLRRSKIAYYEQWYYSQGYL